MRELKTILMAGLVVVALFAAAGTAWASTASLERGTSWTDDGGELIWEDPTGISWERLDF